MFFDLIHSLSPKVTTVLAHLHQFRTYCPRTLLIRLGDTFKKVDLRLRVISSPDGANRYLKKSKPFPILRCAPEQTCRARVRERHWEVLSRYSEGRPTTKHYEKTFFITTRDGNSSASESFVHVPCPNCGNPRPVKYFLPDFSPKFQVVCDVTATKG